MNRIVLGAVSALLLASAGIFWWQGRAETERAAPPPPETLEIAEPGALPSANASGLRGPAPPEATEMSREQRRFARLDRDGDSRITRNEMLSTRTRDFRRLDTDGNNLLTFEEWAVATSNRFKSADANGDGELTQGEFAATAPRPKKKPACSC